MPRFLALLFLFISTQAAVAWFPHGDGSGTPTVQLASVANTFGNKTIAGYGEERLSRTDQNYGARYSPYGTGILVSGSCAKWSTSVTSGTSSYWNLLSHVAEGASAVTPNLTATGVTNLAGGAGSHTDFLVSCEDASNNVLATAALTYNIVDGDNHCGAINIGSTDLINVQYYPTGFASTLDGCYVMFSTGTNRTGRNIINLPFAHTAYLTFADPARPGEMANIEMGTSSTNSVMKNMMVLTQNTNTAGINYAFVVAGTNTSADNIHAYATLAMRSAGSHGCVQTQGSTGGTISHFGCEWYSGFFSPTSNWTYQYGFSRYAAADAIITAGYQHDFNVLDVAILSMKQPVANHPDCFQVGDGATLWNFDVERVMCYQAGGTVGAQGIFFGGGPSGVFGTWTGFVGDCDTGGAAQQICVMTGGAQSNANGSKIFASSGSPMAVSDGVTVNCGGTPCPGASVLTGTGSGTNLTVTWISGSNIVPGSHWLYGTGVPAGTKILSQTSGTTGRSGVYVTSNATTSSGASLTSGPAYPLTGLAGNVNVGSAASPVEFHGSYNVGGVWNQIWNAGYVPQGVFPAANSGTSSISHFTDNYETVSGQTPTPLPHLLYQNCTTNAYAWIGNLTVSKGAEYDTYVSGCTGGVLPNGVTQTNVKNALQNVTTLNSWYVNGDPKACLEAKSSADYDAMTVQALIIYGASCTIPKVAGPLDLGGGDVAGAIGTSLTPTWADGTVVGTGFTGQ